MRTSHTLPSKPTCHFRQYALCFLYAFKPHMSARIYKHTHIHIWENTTNTNANMYHYDSIDIACTHSYAHAHATGHIPTLIHGDTHEPTYHQKIKRLSLQKRALVKNIKLFYNKIYTRIFVCMHMNSMNTCPEQHTSAEYLTQSQEFLKMTSYIYIYIYICINVYTHTHTHMAYICLCESIYIYIYICIYLYIYTHTKLEHPPSPHSPLLFLHSPILLFFLQTLKASDSRGTTMRASPREKVAAYIRVSLSGTSGWVCPGHPGTEHWSVPTASRVWALLDIKSQANVQCCSHKRAHTNLCQPHVAMTFWPVKKSSLRPGKLKLHTQALLTHTHTHTHTQHIYEQVYGSSAHAIHLKQLYTHVHTRLTISYWFTHLHTRTHIHIPVDTSTRAMHTCKPAFDASNQLPTPRTTTFRRWRLQHKGSSQNNDYTMCARQDMVTWTPYNLTVPKYNEKHMVTVTLVASPSRTWLQLQRHGHGRSFRVSVPFTVTVTVAVSASLFRLGADKMFTFGIFGSLAYIIGHVTFQIALVWIQALILNVLCV